MRKTDGQRILDMIDSVQAGTPTELAVRDFIHRREQAARRLARKLGRTLHRARWPFSLWGVRAAYYAANLDNELVAVYATLWDAERDLQSVMEG
jgi:hypothetical protein